MPRRIGEFGRVGGRPHGGRFFVGLWFYYPNLGEYIFLLPLAEALIVVGMKQRPPFIQRRAVSEPAIDDIAFATHFPNANLALAVPSANRKLSLASHRPKLSDKLS